MKKLFFFILSICLGIQINAQAVIGTLINDVTEITTDKTILINSIQEDAKKSMNVDVKITEIKIIQVSDGGYNLKASSENYKVSTLLILNDGKFYYTYGKSKVKTSCETVSCASTAGCEVTMGGYCTKCKGDCKRTQSTGIY